MPTQSTSGQSPASGDSSLAARWQLDELARRYYTPLLSFFRKRSQGPDVEDLVQQVFLHLAQSRDLSHINSPDGYIFQTAANVLKDYHRRRSVREQYADQTGGVITADSTDFSVERVLVGKEAVARLVQALRELPERTRDIVVLRCFEGLKHVEIASLQRISVRAVEKHMHKALVHLSSVLGHGKGVAS